MRRIKPYMLWQYPKIEKWLETKARDGMRLERINGWAFHFRQAEPRDIRIRFFYEQPRTGKLLQTKLELQRLHAEHIHTGLWDSEVMRMSPQVAGNVEHFRARRAEHLRYFGSHALVFTLFGIVFIGIFFFSDVTKGEAVFMLLMTLAVLLQALQFVPAFIMEWRSKP